MSIGVTFPLLLGILALCSMRMNRYCLTFGIFGESVVWETNDYAFRRMAARTLVKRRFVFVGDKICRGAVGRLCLLCRGKQSTKIGNCPLGLVCSGFSHGIPFACYQPSSVVCRKLLHELNDEVVAWLVSSCKNVTDGRGGHI